MRAECPNCEATYDIPDHLVVAGRKVRCARCGNAWAPLAVPFPDHAMPPQSPTPLNRDVAGGLPPGPGAGTDVLARATGTRDPGGAAAIDDPTTPMSMPPEHSAMDRLVSQSVAPPPPSARLKAAWAASVAVIVMLVVGTVIWRQDIARAWPPSAWILAPFGMTAEAHAPAR